MVFEVDLTEYPYQFSDVHHVEMGYPKFVT